MKSPLTTLLITLGIISTLTIFGCGSRTSDPALPSLSSEPDMSAMSTAAAGHNVLGVFDLFFDPDSSTLELTESRGTDAHYNITGFIGPHLYASTVTWDPSAGLLEFNLSITNPTNINVYDVRTLFLSDTASGYTLLNPDDYTMLFNPFGPDVKNPFRAYAKSATKRIFAAGATHTEHFSISCPPSFGGSAKILIECSWPGNCEDAYEISNQTQSNPVTATVPAVITLDAYDHQNNIDSISIDTTPITGGLTWLAKGAGSKWEATIFNVCGAEPGIFECWIAAQNLADPPDLFDLMDIHVGPVIDIPEWDSTDYPVNPGTCYFDLGVIADPSGPRDSEILMVGNGTGTCDAIVKHDPYYSGQSIYVNLVNYDAGNMNYQPYPVLRIDAADDGAFSFTNNNIELPFPFPISESFNYQVWSVFDNLPMLHTGPAPDEGRYYFTFADYDVTSRPVDVCDDFTLGQYAIFSTGVTFSMRDIVFIGTMPGSYTHDRVRYVGNLDDWEGLGHGLVNPAGIKGIDVIENSSSGGGQSSCVLYILEEAWGTYEVEVFKIFNTVPAWLDDFVDHVMTIDIHLPDSIGIDVTGHDIELLPVNPKYMENAINPTLSVLVSYNAGADIRGEVLLYDATLGTILESIGKMADPAMPGSIVHYLDTDDDDWEIHVTRDNPAGNPVVTVFSYD